MSTKDLLKKQEQILKDLKQQLKTKEFNKVCKAIECEYKIALATR